MIGDSVYFVYQQLFESLSKVTCAERRPYNYCNVIEVHIRLNLSLNYSCS